MSVPAPSQRLLRPAATNLAIRPGATSLSIDSSRASVRTTPPAFPSEERPSRPPAARAEQDGAPRLTGRASGPPAGRPRPREGPTAVGVGILRSALTAATREVVIPMLAAARPRIGR